MSSNSKIKIKTYNAKCFKPGCIYRSAEIPEAVEGHDLCECSRQERCSVMGMCSHNSRQKLTHASNLIHNFKVVPYHIAKAISPDTSKGHTSLDISRFNKHRTLLDLLTGLRLAKIQGREMDRWYFNTASRRFFYENVCSYKKHYSTKRQQKASF